MDPSVVPNSMPSDMLRTFTELYRKISPCLSPVRDSVRVKLPFLLHSRVWERYSSKKSASGRVSLFPVCTRSFSVESKMYQ
ncbi:hypothetical protein WA538_005785 [Blastocystis sp. DL]